MSKKTTVRKPIKPSMGRDSTGVRAGNHQPIAPESKMNSGFDLGSMMMLPQLGSDPRQGRDVYLVGEIEENMINMIIQQLISFDSISHDPINLIISTYGGNCNDMFALYDIMKFVNSPIRTIGVGKIMSAGVLILAAGEKGNRIIMPHARIMLHGVSGFAQGNVFDMKNEIEEMTIIEETTDAAIVKETKLTKKKLQEINRKMLNKYIDAHCAIQYGIADKLGVKMKK